MSLLDLRADPNPEGQNDVSPGYSGSFGLHGDVLMASALYKHWTCLLTFSKSLVSFKTVSNIEVRPCTCAALYVMMRGKLCSPVCVKGLKHRDKSWIQTPALSRPCVQTERHSDLYKGTLFGHVSGSFVINVQRRKAKWKQHWIDRNDHRKVPCPFGFSFCLNTRLHFETDRTPFN